MIVECTYPNAEKECIYRWDGEHFGHKWKKGDRCLHSYPHEKIEISCFDDEKCSCKYTFKCQMLEAIKSERKNKKNIIRK